MEKARREKIVHTFLQNPTWSCSKVAKILKFPKTTVAAVIKRFKTTQSTNRATKPATKKASGTPPLRKNIIRSIQQNPSLSDADRAKKCRTSRSTARRIRIEHKYKSYRASKCPNRSMKQNKTAKTRARKLYLNVLTKFGGCILMDDETYIKMDFNQIPGPRYYAAKKRGGVAKKFKHIGVDKFGKKLLVWQGICSCGLKTRAFVTSGTMTSELYMKECLEKRLLPFIRRHQGSVKFWPDLASCHYSKATLLWYKANSVDFIPKEMNPPNCPELRPIEKYWALIKMKLRKWPKVVKNANSLTVNYNKVAAKFDRKSVQNLMGGIKRKTREFAYSA